MQRSREEFESSSAGESGLATAPPAKLQRVEGAEGVGEGSSSSSSAAAGPAADAGAEAEGGAAPSAEAAAAEAQAAAESAQAQFIMQYASQLGGNATVESIMAALAGGAGRPPPGLLNPHAQPGGGAHQPYAGPGAEHVGVDAGGDGGDGSGGAGGSGGLDHAAMLAAYGGGEEQGGELQGQGHHLGDGGAGGMLPLHLLPPHLHGAGMLQRRSLGGGNSRDGAAATRAQWSASEDDALITAVHAGDAAGATRKDTYDAAAALIPTRTARAIKDRIGRHMSTGRLPPAPPPVNGWTAAEDEALMAVVQAGDAAGATRAVTFVAAAAAIPGRATSAVEARIYHLLSSGRLVSSAQAQAAAAGGLGGLLLPPAVGAAAGGGAQFGEGAAADAAAAGAGEEAAASATVGLQQQQQQQPGGGAGAPGAGGEGGDAAAASGAASGAAPGDAGAVSFDSAALFSNLGLQLPPGFTLPAGLTLPGGLSLMQALQGIQGLPGGALPWGGAAGGGGVGVSGPLPPMHGWTAGEDDALIATVQAGDQAGATRMDTHAAAATVLPGRSASAIEARIQYLTLCGRLPLMAHAAKDWTLGEDEALIHQVMAGDAAGSTRAATYANAVGILPGRTIRAMKHRTQYLTSTGRLPPAPQGAKDWKPDEDEALVAAVLAGDAAGTSRTSTFAAFAAASTNRSANAVKQRVSALMTSGKLAGRTGRSPGAGAGGGPGGAADLVGGPIV